MQTGGKNMTPNTCGFVGSCCDYWSVLCCSLETRDVFQDSQWKEMNWSCKLTPKLRNPYQYCNYWWKNTFEDFVLMMVMYIMDKRTGIKSPARAIPHTRDFGTRKSQKHLPQVLMCLCCKYSRTLREAARLDRKETVSSPSPHNSWNKGNIPQQLSFFLETMRGGKHYSYPCSVEDE